MTLNLARGPFTKQTSSFSFVILGAKRIERVNVNETYLPENGLTTENTVSTSTDDMFDQFFRESHGD